MTNKELYFEAKKLQNKYLNDSCIKNLLIDANGFINFSELITCFNHECKDESKFLSDLKRVLDGEPIQYVLGHAEFLDLDLDVNPSVLIPRQETEELALIVSKAIREDKDFVNVGDICTGSGALAIKIKKDNPHINMFASDISEEAIDIAANNASKHNQSISFFIGDMLTPFLKMGIILDVLVCNPPYIEREEEIDEQVYKYEPHSALIAKPDTKYYEEIFKHVDEIMNQKYLIALEIGEDMEDKLIELMKKYLSDATFLFKKDIYGKLRFLLIRGE